MGRVADVASTVLLLCFLVIVLIGNPHLLGLVILGLLFGSMALLIGIVIGSI